MTTKTTKATTLKDYYRLRYPSDSAGLAYIHDSANFADAYASLRNGEWNKMEFGDSLMRERLFRGMAEAYGKSYAAIYERWLKYAKKEAIHG